MRTMAHNIPTTEPVKHIIGDTATWKKSLPDYPADESWVLAYTLINGSDKQEITSSASGADHLVSVSDTSSWTAGDFHWQAKVSKGAETYTVATGMMTLVAGFAAPTALDARSHAEKMLSNIESWLETRNPAVAKYQIAGRNMEYVPIPDLSVLRDKYRREVYAEKQALRAASGLPKRNSLKVRF